MPLHSSRRVDHYRVLRSDGKPSFSSSKHRIEGDAERICSKPPIGVNKTTPLFDSIRLMRERGVRSLVIKETGERLWGMVLAEDIVNYLGGGELYDLVLNRFDGDINRALSIPIDEIGQKNYPFVYSDAKLNVVIDVIFDNRVDIVPVVYREGKVAGVISVHDILRYLKGVNTNKRAGDSMLGFVPALDYSSTLKEAMRTLHNSGIRFVLVMNEVGQIVGYLDYRIIINFFASGSAFRYSTKGILEEALLIPIGELAKRDIVAFNEDSSLTSVISEMLERNMGFALVEREDRPIGILTEFDVLMSMLSGD